MELISLLLANKYLVGVFGALLGAVLLYYRGYKSGSNQVKLEQKQDAEALNSDVRKAEAKNMDLQQEKDLVNEKAITTRTISALIGLFNSLQSKTGSSDTKPDSK